MGKKSIFDMDPKLSVRDEIKKKVRIEDDLFLFPSNVFYINSHKILELYLYIYIYIYIYI